MNETAFHRVTEFVFRAALSAIFIADGAGPMLKNIGLFGALLHFAANGSSNFSLDRKGRPVEFLRS